MDNEQKYSDDIITKIFKLIISKEQYGRYVKFAKNINDYLKQNYNRYFLCNILLQDKEDSNIIYSVELYNNIDDKKEEFEKLYLTVENMYKEEFGDDIKRSEITDISEIRRILPK